MLRRFLFDRFRDAGDDGYVVTCASLSYLLPFIALAPLAGWISARLPLRVILVGTALVSLSITFILALRAGGAASNVPATFGLVALGGIGLSSAVSMTSLYACLRQVAKEARRSLLRTNAWFGAGMLVSILGGMFLEGWPFLDNGTPFAMLLGLYGVAAVIGGLLTPSLAVPFRESPATIPQRSLAEIGRIARSPEARNALLGLASAWGLGGILFQLAPSRVAILGLSAGLAGGCLAASVVAHPRRGLGWVPLAYLLLFGFSCRLLHSVEGWWSWCGAGFSLGLMFAPLATAFQGQLSAESSRYGIAFQLSLLVLGLVSFPAGAGILNQALDVPMQLTILAGLGAIVAGYVWFRELLEMLTSLVFLLFYRIRVRGPGLEAFPVQGSVLVVANHAAWFDPFWLGKVIPRRLIPLMGSVFYDLPVVSWLMRNVIQAIRVPEVPMRRETPELDEAIARLDQGECVVLFPEGRLRRRAEIPLQHFGQGVWRILQDRPQTIIVPCWIEGGWGSYTSYYLGPPTRHKRMDWFRPITVVMGEPERVPTEVLMQHQTTRKYLEERVLALRSHLPPEAASSASTVISRPDTLAHPAPAEEANELDL
jgi:1-acyl-sn-glycerol-3-phosphate acyltransferase